MTGNKIKGFDGIRGLAVLSVVFTHVWVWGYLAEKGWLTEKTMPLVTGTTGVQAFFVLSGFLITMLLLREREKTGTVSLLNFYTRRTLRILPLYVLFLILITVIHIVGNSVTSWQSLSYAYMYIYNFVPRHGYTSVLGHTWSLAVEEHFYLIWPLIFVKLQRRNVLTALLVGFIVSSCIVFNLLQRVDPLSSAYFVHRWSFVAGSGIAAGCLAALLICGGRDREWWRGIARHPLTFWLGVLLFVNSIYLGDDRFLLTHYLRDIGLAAIVSWLFMNQSSLLVRLLEFRPLRYVGLISYSVYIYQGLFLATNPGRSLGQSWPPDALTGLVLLVIVAPLSYHGFEKPFLQLKQRYSTKDEHQEAIQTVPQLTQ